MALIDEPRDRLSATLSAIDRTLELIRQGMTAEQAAYVVALELRVTKLAAIEHRVRSDHEATRPVGERRPGPVHRRTSYYLGET
jgi:uncharacterized protein YoaH (UPF0181 family)